MAYFVKNKNVKVKNRLRNTVVLAILLIIPILGYAENPAYYENLLKLAEKESDNHNYAKSLEYLVEVKIYAKNNKLHTMHALSVNKMGLIYMDMLYYEKAMECYLEAYQIVLKVLDKTNEMGILNNIAKLYFLSNDLDKATEYLDKAYKMAIETEDTAIMIFLLNNLVSLSNKKKDWVQTEYYLNLVMEKIKQFPQDPYIIVFQLVKAEYLYLKKEYDSAAFLVLQALNQDTGKMRKDLQTEYLFLLSKIDYEKKNYSQAAVYAKEALQNCFDLLMSIEIYEHLSIISRATNSYALTWQYQDSIKMMKDSLIKRNSLSQILSGQIQFDLNNMEEKMAKNNAKQKRNQLVFVFILVFALAVFLSILYIHITKSRQLKRIAVLELEKEKKEKFILEQYSKEQEILALLEQERANNEIKEKMLLKQQLKEQEKLAMLEQRIYRNEIKMKNKQLVSKTLFQLNKNEMIGEIIHTLSLIPKQSEVPELKPIIHKLKSQLKEPTAWKSFLTYFEQINPDFLSNLKEKHPDLTAANIRLASYIYLDLDTKEIAKLLNITPEYCRKKKQRLAQNLGTPSAKIYSYLMGLK